MKRGFLLILLIFTTLISFAQPPKRRAEMQRKNARSNADNLTARAQISFPTSASMPEDVVWRRDVYRLLDLHDDKNSGLYYPQEQIGSQMNLFALMFKLMLTGRVPAYRYPLDGVEIFNDSTRIKPLSFLDNYHIYYERTDRGIHIDNSDIPSREVTQYYIKETNYFDQSTSTFHTKVLAICPILIREDDFGDAGQKYPLFWMEYEQLAPYLTKQTIMTSNLNNAATMSLNDFFAMNHYRGGIYKTNNMLGKTLAQVANGDTAKIALAQRQIEKEIAAFEERMWGDPAVKDSLDSIAKLNPKEVKKIRKKQNRRERTVRKANKKVSRSKSESSPASPPARVSVRRQRH